MYEIRFSRTAEKSLRRISKNPSFNRKRFAEILTLLATGTTLPATYKDHSLKGEFVGLRECHIGFDMLIMYERDVEMRVITVADIGTHDDLFG